jgi:hypothetical protein
MQVEESMKELLKSSIEKQRKEEEQKKLGLENQIKELQERQSLHGRRRSSIATTLGLLER